MSTAALPSPSTCQSVFTARPELCPPPFLSAGSSCGARSIKDRGLVAGRDGLSGLGPTFVKPFPL